MLLIRRILFSRTFLDLPILLFTIVGILSIVTAVDPKYSFQEFVGEWVKGVFLFSLVANNIRRDQMKYILGALLAGNVLMVGYGIIDFFLRGGILFDYKVRAASLHSGMGTFGTYLLTITPFLVASFLVIKTRSSLRIWIWILLCLNIFALILNFSEGAWVASAALGVILILKLFPGKIVIFFLILGFLGIFFLLPNPSRSFYHRFSDISAPLNHYNARWILAKFSFEKIMESPFRMIGFGQRSFVKKFRGFTKVYKQLWHAHNTFLNIALQTGLQGVILFFFLLYRILKYCHEEAKLDENLLEKFYFTGTFMMVVTFFVRNLSDDFFIDDSALLFWFLVGMAFALQNHKKKFPFSGIR